MRTSALLLALGVLVAPPAVAAERLVGPPEGGPAFAGDGRGWMAAGRPLAVPEGTQLVNAVALSGGTAAAGVTRVDDGTELVVVAPRNGRPRMLAAPPSVGGRLRTGPVLLAMAGELAGIAWLEGDHPRRLEVWAAARRGGRWGRAEKVAGPAPGSQVALTGAVLADGSWLLAWSAFDGRDDEILWSRRGTDGWSSPARVAGDDRTPDATPQLLADGAGALLAWAAFEGDDYRVRTARFDGEGWSAGPVAGPAGSTEPAWARLGGHVQLLFREAGPRSWTVLELGSDGRPLRRASVAAAGEERPLLAPDLAGLAFADRTAPLAWDAVR